MATLILVAGCHRDASLTCREMVAGDNRDVRLTCREMVVPTQRSLLGVASAQGVILAVDIIGQVFRTDDAGATWTVAKDVPQAPVGSAWGSPSAFFVQTRSALFRSLDQGRTWGLVPLPATQLGFVTGTPAGTVYVAANDTFPESLLRTTDGGDSWQSVPLPDNASRTVRFWAADTGLLAVNGYYRAGEGGSTSFLISCDGGATWLDALRAGLFEAVGMSADGTTVFAGGPDLQSTTDGGKSWTVLREGRAADGTICSLDQVAGDPNIALVGVQSCLHPQAPYSQVPSFSTDGGRTWNPVACPEIGPFRELFWTGAEFVYAGYNQQGQNVVGIISADR